MAPPSAPIVRQRETERNEDAEEDDGGPTQRPRQRLRLSAARCRVCRSSAHRAGFVDGVYRDCPRRPCYLCGSAAHVASACPHRPVLAPRVGAAAAANASSSFSSSSTALPSLLARRQGGGTGAGRLPPAAANAALARAHYSEEDEDGAGGPWRVSAACLNLHSGRVTCVAFPCAASSSSSPPSSSSSSLVASGDRHGGVALWNFDSVHERTYYPPGGIFRSLVNCLEFPSGMPPAGCGALPGVGAAGDGTVRLFDPETGARRTLLELAPSSSSSSSSAAAGKGMVYSVSAAPDLGAFLASDNRGCVHVLDARQPTRTTATAGGRGAAAAVAVVHKPGAKVNAVAACPFFGALAVTGANDHTVRLLDLRRLSCSSFLPSPPPASARNSGGGGGGGGSAATLATLPHGGVVAHAAFCGAGLRGIVTTCHDNRLRVWDDVSRIRGDAAAAAPLPCREIVHSHNFSRHLTYFRAVPDPKCPALAVVGRFLSEARPSAADGGARVSLHPVDAIDLTSGRLVAAMADESLPTVPSVNAAHPLRDVVVTGSSRSVYVWARRRRREGAEEGARRPAGAWAAAQGGKGAQAHRKGAAGVAADGGGSK